MAKLRVKVVACKGIGPRALRALEELGIETLIADPSLRTVREVLDEALRHLGTAT
jgi:predicted Fe-Mo cluster-binding NifX family protein